MAGYGAKFTLTFHVRNLRSPKQFDIETTISNTDIKLQIDWYHWFYYEYCNYVLHVRFMHAFKRYEQNKNTVQQKGKIDMYT